MSQGIVVVGMSGGVDSSVAAMLLKQQGWKVVGLFMKNWEDDDDAEYCSSRQDLIDVAAVCDILGVELEVVNFSAEYKERVFAEFLREYKAGRTPNPDVLCNAEIKFKAFLDHALALGAEKIATGHYAQVREVPTEMGSEFQLLKAEDGTKDQSYFLYRLNQAQLSKTLFPLGQTYKREVRKLAQQAGLPNFAKKDSTGICFIGERPFKEFLERYIPRQPGEIRTLDGGKVVGEHHGLMYHTLGQRKGLGIGGIAGGDGSGHKGGDRDGEHDAWYVAGKDMEKNILYVVQGHEHPALLADRLKAIDLTWVNGRLPHTHWVYTAKTRYRQPDAPCEVETVSAERCEVIFAQPQWAVTPGQSVVLYDSKVCLGGGVIE
ncbi:MAG: tRNA 2-thiouridine(34) synthase MnmA [Betaproteobacteria bacterium]|nr:tRNA 2-thiouridine(34) synthase MnmA [Betaproteobacteria bacterium]